MLLYQKGTATTKLTDVQIREGINTALQQLGERKKVLVIPPDFTRYHSYAGEITCMLDDHFGDCLTDILPALGTHTAMTEEELDKMFPGICHSKFRVHDWRNDVVTVGTVPAEFVSEVSEGKVNYPWPAQVNKLLVEGDFDLIISVGQVVPHEVVGMANYNKNIFVGTGGSEGINKSHFIGAVYGMERMMGRGDTPVRKVLNYASEHFIHGMPLIYIQTVVGKDETGRLAVRGLYIGDDSECFDRAAELALQVNFQMLDREPKKIVVYLDPSEFRSTWLGNKSIYRTRMAIATGGELIVLAPALKEFGEDKTIDGLIRKYGYAGTPNVLKWVTENDDLKANLGAAAHLIHGSTEGRFTVTYCPGPGITKQEIEHVHFHYGDLNAMMTKYQPEKLKDGWNIVDDEEIFYISNPGLGLWAYKDRFK